MASKDQVAAPGWTLLDVTRLADQTGMTNRQVQYNFVKYFKTRGGGSGSLYEVQTEDIKTFKVVAVLVKEGFGWALAVDLAKKMREAETYFADSRGVRVEIHKEAWPW